MVINNDGGTQSATDFTFQVNGGSAVNFLEDTDALHGENTMTVDAGTYLITEPEVSGYTTTYENCSDVAVPNGGTQTCTITNDDQPATLIVIKHVDNGAGSGASASDFSMSVTGTNVSTSSFPGAESPGTTVTMDPGSYSVSEDMGGYAGQYDVTYSEDCSGSIDFGDSKTCTVTNTKRGKIILQKETIPDGASQLFQFQTSWLGDGTESYDFELGDGDSQTSDWLVPGTYSVSEILPAGWALQSVVTSDGGNDPANLVLDAGETLTVTFTNIQGSILTDASYCGFDRNPDTPEREFRLLFTPDVQNYPAYKLSASNPGQFSFNVFYYEENGDGTVDVTFEIPYPFVTQGAMPAHVYDQVSISTNDQDQTCLDPVGDGLAYPLQVTMADWDGMTFGDTLTRTITDVPVSLGSFVYANIHLAYGLKGGEDRYSPNVNADGSTDALDYFDPSQTLIEDAYNFVFNAYIGNGSDPYHADTFVNQNEFKVTPGVAGFAFRTAGEDPEVYTGQDITIRLVIPKSVKNAPAPYLEATTDEDGWYMIEYKHTGKPTNYKFEVYRGSDLIAEKTVQLHGNEFEEVNIYLDGSNGGGGGSPAGTVHVADLQGSSKVTKKSWNATVSISIQDENGASVPAAQVSGRWTVDGVETAAYCETDDTGACTVTLSKLDPSISSVSFEVTDVFLDGSTYDADNSVTSIEISQ